MNSTENDSQPTASNGLQEPGQPYSAWRVRFGLTVTLFGYAVFIVGAKPGIVGLDRSPIIGFVQIAVFLVGLAIICMGGYISLMALWMNRTRSIVADFGLRFVATGYVVAVFCGMADVFGFGSHPLPGVPFFGYLQARGVMLGQVLIAIGFLMLLPFSPPVSREKEGQKKASEPDNPQKPSDYSIIKAGLSLSAFLHW
jgi:hypothetical protein